METKKKYKLVLSGFIIMVILNVVVLGSLWILRPPFHHNRNIHTEEPHRVQRFLHRQLELTREQEEQFRGLRDDYRGEVRSILNDIRGTRRQLYQTLPSADPRMSDSLLASLAEGHGQLEQKNMQHFREMRALLDKGQQQKFDRIMQRLADRVSSRQL